MNTNGHISIKNKPATATRLYRMQFIEQVYHEIQYR